MQALPKEILKKKIDCFVFTNEGIYILAKNIQINILKIKWYCL